MTFLLDTDTSVSWLRGSQSVREHVAAVGVQRIAVSVITLAELRYGAAFSSRPEANHHAIDAFMSGITILGVDPAVAWVFGDVKTDLRNRGLLIDDFDILIAATALTGGLTVVTNNSAHFGRVPGLQFENWL